jgi:flavin reductase (DIM6/NTAB) family NADH-FMN oxidoreductase RutF
MALSDDFKEALASWASGVSVVATRAGGLVYGLTVSSFTSLSLEPPLILVCLATRNKLPAMIRESGRFAVSVLAAEQDAASAAFSRSGREATPTFVGVDEDRTSAGMPVVRDAMVHICCELHNEMLVGDHMIVVGKVVEARTRHDREPLLYHRRRYRVLDGSEAR